MPELNTSNLEKIPPQNIEAEQSVLGCLLIEQEAITKIADLLKADDFYKTDHQKIYEAVTDLYEKRQPIDILSVTARLEEKKQLETVGGRSYLTSLANIVATASHVFSYAQIVQKKATLRRLINAATEIVQMGFKEEAEDVTRTLDRAESRLFGVSQQFLKQKFTPMKDLLADAFERIDELHRESGKLRGVPSGFKDLDNKLAGLQKSDLIILAARPSMGKTSLALDICRQVALYQKIPVGIFSLEMSKEQLVERMLCAESGVDSWKLRTGRLSDKEEMGESDFSRLGHAMGELAEAPIFIDDSPTGSIMEIRTKARRLQAEKGLGMIMIDYLQLMEGGADSTVDNRVQVVSEISRGLKSIARELNIPVLALSQLSRQVESRPTAIPKLADLRESGSIEQDADVVLFIYREKMYKKDTPRGNITDIYIAKHRNGPTGMVELYFDEQRTSFKNLEKKMEGLQPPAEFY
ncbi:MAG: replicative DNA helicase [Patescibacteria group bacterium]|nr:replicative DNA helicase [Patescibacteria group bacterium]